MSTRIPKEVLLFVYFPFPAFPFSFSFPSPATSQPRFRTRSNRARELSSKSKTRSGKKRGLKANCHMVTWRRQMRLLFFSLSIFYLVFSASFYYTRCTHTHGSLLLDRPMAMDREGGDKGAKWGWGGNPSLAYFPAGQGRLASWFLFLSVSSSR